MMMNNGGQLPSQRPISITQICITGMMYLGQGNGDDFWFNVDQGRDNQVYSAHIGKYSVAKVTQLDFWANPPGLIPVSAELGWV